jgi:O-antigen/teichoic acid export membrane protein
MSESLEQAPSVDAARPGIDPSRLPEGAGSLRRTAARGTLINSGFQIGLSALNVVQRVVVAAFLTRAEFGLWGVVASVVINLSWLKDFGIADKFIQQSEPDQEAEFQKAFTLELATSVAFAALVAVLLPLWALAYGHAAIIVPGVLLAISVPISAFESPAWIPYRRMQYARQRLLTVVDPVIVFAVTIALAVAGAGYWCFIAGVLAGSVAGAAVCAATSPYRIRLRFERGTVRRYASFSLPLVGAGLSRLLVVQGALIVANHVGGLAGVGAIGLATTYAVFADRVDAIVSQTIYPAVCAVAHRRSTLAEVFVKTNRVALMWAMPFGAGLALFGGDLVHFVLGDRWSSAVPLLAAFGLTCGIGQVAFNWTVFLRAVNETRPILTSAFVNVAVFLIVSVPAMIAFGITGYAVGFAAANLVQIVLRGYYMRRLFSGFNVLRQLGRAIAPTIPPSVLILLERALVDGHRTPARAVTELVVYALVTIAMTMLLERRLVSEMVGYLSGRRTGVPAPVGA